MTLPDIGLAVRVFANGPGDLGSIPGRVIPKTQKMVLDASLLNTQHYKVRIKGKVEQSREGVAPSPTPWCRSFFTYYDLARPCDELISDVLQWTPAHGRAKAERPARNYIQQLCEDTGYSPEDLPEAMNDREEWQERVRDIHAGGTTWW